MFKPSFGVLLPVGATGCVTPADSGVRYLTASSGEQAMRMRKEIAGCKRINWESGKADSDTMFRKRPVQYGADTLLVIRTTTFGPVNPSTPTSVKGDTPSSPPAERPEFVTDILAEYYRCGARP